MTFRFFKKRIQQTGTAIPPVSAPEEQQFRSPFTDTREDAADNWARPTPQNTTGSVPVNGSQTTWQETGFHMEDVPADFAQVLDDTNEQRYVRPEATDWYEDPFRDQAEDKNLVKHRSDAVRNHQGPFFGQDTQAPQSKPRGKAGSRVWLYVSLIVVVLVTVGAIVYSSVFRIATISVEGNVRFSDAEIIELSGIRLGDNVLQLDEKKIGDRIETNSYLVFGGVSRLTFRDVQISVYERTPVAFIISHGSRYIIDSRGNLLEQDSSIENIPGLLRVEGISVKGATEGERISVDTAYEIRLALYADLMLELKAMGAVGEITELYVNNMDSIYLVTHDGYSVHFGDSSSLHAKLRSTLLTVAELRARGSGVGTIDVSVPESPSYIPENITY